MEDKVNFTVVGLFVLVLGTALVAGVLWLSSGKRYGQAYTDYLTYMTESVAGLNVNAPVKFRGVDVGFVRAIDLDPKNVEHVRLTLAIQRETPVKVDTIAVMETQGLTGIAFVDLLGGRNQSPALRPAPNEPLAVIRSGPSLMGRLEQSATTLLASVTRAADGFSALVDEDNRRALSKTLADLQVVSRTLAARAPTIDRTIADASRTLAGTAKLPADVARLAARLEASADRFDRMTESLARAGASGEKALAGSGADLQRFTAEGLPELRQLIGDLRDTVGTLQRVGSELERDPSALVWGRAPAKKGPGE